MNFRNLGSTGLKVSELGLGCSSLGNSVFNYGNEDEFLAVLNFAFENGINFFDTADTYAFGNSETLIGKAFRNKRDKIIIATKVGFLPSSLSSHAKNFIPLLGSARKLIKPFKKGLKKLSKTNQNFSAEHIRQSIEKSLVRLKTDYIDVYLLHNPPAKIIKEGEVFKILDDLKAEGKIRFYGVSAGSIDDAVMCTNYPEVSVLQVEFNLLNQEAASKLFSILEKKQIGIIARVPLARGLLTVNGKVKTGSFSYNKKYNAKQKLNLSKLENEINKNILPEAAFRFILGYQQVSTIIAGTRSVSHLKQNLKTLTNPHLTQGELEKIIVDFSSKISNHSVIKDSLLS
jgi:aryl-alcohol dehydrogenase-like predicted oxidoreductase